MLEYLAFRLLSLLAPLVPPVVAYRLCDGIGDLAYRLLSRRRDAVRRNLSIVLRGRSENLDRLARLVFREGAKYYYDTFRVPALSDTELEKLISVDGWERLDRALEKGKGVILFSAHLGSPALVVQILGAKKYRTTTVVEPVRPRRLLDLMMRIRGAHGLRLVLLGPNSTRELVEALGRNEALGMVVDRDVQRNGVPVNFFGVGSTLPAGPVMLSLRTGAVLLPAFTYRLGSRLTGTIGEPLELERTGELRQDLRRNTQRLAGVLEQAIELKPEQWTVFEPIWPEAGAGSAPGAAS